MRIKENIEDIAVSIATIIVSFLIAIGNVGVLIIGFISCIVGIIFIILVNNSHKLAIALIAIILFKMYW
jgi:hypothetical protein